MLKIADIVQQKVEQSPFLGEALVDGLINISALARKLKPEVEKELGREVKTGAIIMAINRMPNGEKIHLEKSMREFFRKVGPISVRSKLLDFTFANSEELVEKQAQLLQVIPNYPKSFFTYSQGAAETTIIVSDALRKEILRIFKGEKLLDLELRISAISLSLPKENRHIYGLYYFILKELAMFGINLVEVISTSNEFIVIVNENDLNLAFSVINGLRKR